MRPRHLLFSGTCLLLVLFFHGGLTSNPVSRLLTVFAVVEDHTLRADRWRSLTIDYAQIDGHIYSDKAPLSSFVVLPLYWAFRAPSHRAQVPTDRGAANHLAVFIAAGVPFAIFALLLLWRALRGGIAPGRAVWTALGAAFGTCLASYGGIYFGHMLASTLFLGAYVLAVERQQRFVLAGFLGGCAVLAEYPLALTQALLLGYLALGPRPRYRALRYVLGAVPPALALLAYNAAVTGRPLELAYAHVPAQWAAMRTHFGIRLPAPASAWELVFGQFRGAAFFAPVLLVLVPLVVLHFDGPPGRRRLVLLTMASYLALIASYFKWDGGYCVGPRHLAPVIALALYEGIGALARAPRARPAFALLSCWGVVLNLVAGATENMPADTEPRPAFEVFVPHLIRGEINRHNLFAEWHLPSGRYLLLVWWVLFVALAALCSRAFARPLERGG
jgi:hypothetical protein